MDHAVSQVAAGKHGKRSDGVDWLRTLEQFGNALAKVFEDSIFGYFEEVRLKPFKTDRYTGIFRSIRGRSAAFNDIYFFEGPKSFPQQFVFVFNLANKTGLQLSPLFIRGLDSSSSHYVEPDVFLYDLARGDDYGFKAVQEREGVQIAKEGSFAELHDAVAELAASDLRLEPILDFEFRARDSR